MPAHRRQHVAQRLDRSQDVGADRRVPLHLLVLLGGEHAPLLEHPVLDPDLPHVVEERADPEPLLELLGLAEVPGDRPAQRGDPLRMPAGVRILGVDRRRERPDRADEQPLVRRRRLLEPADVLLDVAAHPVEVGGELGELEGHPLLGKAAAEAAVGDLVGGLREPLDRPSHPAGGDRGDQQRDEHEHPEGDHGGQCHLARRPEGRRGRLMDHDPPAGLLHRADLPDHLLPPATDLHGVLGRQVERLAHEVAHEIRTHDLLPDLRARPGRPEEGAPVVDEEGADLLLGLPLHDHVDQPQARDRLHDQLQIAVGIADRHREGHRRLAPARQRGETIGRPAGTDRLREEGIEDHLVRARQIGGSETRPRPFPVEQLQLDQRAVGPQEALEVVTHPPFAQPLADALRAGEAEQPVPELEELPAQRDEALVELARERGRRPGEEALLLRLEQLPVAVDQHEAGDRDRHRPRSEQQQEEEMAQAQAAEQGTDERHSRRVR